jgi:hypothetical protein
VRIPFSDIQKHEALELYRAYLCKEARGDSVTKLENGHLLFFVLVLYLPGAVKEVGMGTFVATMLQAWTSSRKLGVSWTVVKPASPSWYSWYPKCLRKSQVSSAL